MRTLSLKFATLAVLSVSTVFWSYSAGAVTYTAQFTASGFGIGAPTDPVSGTLVFDKSATDFSVNSLTSIDLTIAGHSYGIGEIGTTVGAISGNIFVGATVNGVNTVAAGDTDFFLSWEEDTGAFAGFTYSCDSCSIFFRATAGVVLFTEGDLQPVPIPPAIALFATGIAGIGWLARRRKKQAA